MSQTHTVWHFHTRHTIRHSTTTPTPHNQPEKTSQSQEGARTKPTPPARKPQTHKHEPLVTQPAGTNRPHNHQQPSQTQQTQDQNPCPAGPNHVPATSKNNTHPTHPNTNHNPMNHLTHPQNPTTTPKTRPHQPATAPPTAISSARGCHGRVAAC